MLRRRRATGFYNTPSAPLFPGTVVPVVWLDGDRLAFSDIAGATPAVTGGPFGYINEPAPLTGNFQASSVGQRPTRDSNGIRSDYGGVSFPGQQIVSLAPTAIPLNNSTIAITYVDRDGFGGPNEGLCAAFPTLWGLVVGGGALSAYVNSSGFPTGVTFPRATKTSVVVRYTPTALKVLQVTAGAVVANSTISVAITGGSTGGSGIAVFNGSAGAQGCYGSVTQIQIVDRAVTDTEALAMALANDAKPMPAGYPTSAPLVGICGDSIARAGAGVNANDGWCWVMQQTLRGGASPNLEICNVAIVGSGVSPSMYSALTPFYSASRSKNVVVLASGTNDLANGNSAASTTTALFAACGVLRAQGWKVVVATCLPRTDTMAVSQAAFDAARATYNANIAAGSANYDALADAASVAGMSTNADCNAGINYAVDKVHPNGVGHRLLEPTYRAAISPLV